MLDPKCIYRKSIFAKCTRLACLLSFASLFSEVLIVPESTPEVTHFSHIFGKKSMLVTRGKLFEEKVGLNEEDVLLDQC